MLPSVCHSCSLYIAIVVQVGALTVQVHMQFLTDKSLSIAIAIIYGYCDFKDWHKVNILRGNSGPCSLSFKFTHRHDCVICSHGLMLSIFILFKIT